MDENQNTPITDQADVVEELLQGHKAYLGFEEKPESVPVGLPVKPGATPPTPPEQNATPTEPVPAPEVEEPAEPGTPETEKPSFMKSVRQYFTGEPDSETEDEVTYHGVTYKKDHLDEKGHVKDEYKSLYKKGSGYMYSVSGGELPVWEDVGQQFRHMFQYLSAPGLGMIDFAVDASTTMLNRMGHNAENINKQWDTVSQLDAPGAQRIREFSAVAIPSIYASFGVGSYMAATRLPWLAKWAFGAAGAAASDAAIIGVSDQGLEQNAVIGKLGKSFPSVFGPTGIMPMPEWTQYDKINKNDPQAPWKTRVIGMLDQAGMSVVGDMVGLGLSLALPVAKRMGWFVPKSEAAQAYKQLEIAKTDPETYIRIKEIDQALATDPSAANAAALKAERQRYIDQIENTGASDLTTKDAFEQQIEVSEATRRQQLDEVAILKLEADPATFGNFAPELTPGLATPGELARQTIPPANVARNMADVAALQMGKTVGDPAPVLTESMLKKGLVLGKSRNAVKGVAEASRDVGDFDAIVDGFRMTGKQMDQAYDQLYVDIMQAPTGTDVRKLFVDNRAMIPLADGTIINPLNPMQERSAGLAIKDLVDMYLGRDVTTASMRVMSTLGHEIRTAAEARRQFGELVDDDRVVEVVLDKLEFLMQEYGTNKYIAGWQLQNKNWFNKLRSTDSPAELTELINDEFQQAINAKHASVKNFVDTLRGLHKENPELMKPLFDAFEMSNGNVDTIHKLVTWAKTQMSPFGLIRSKDPKKMNMFARTLYGVLMNNVLSVKSIGSAAKGNLAKLMLQPMEGILGHGIQSLEERSLAPMKRAFYYYGSNWETQRRALGDAITRIKATHQDYDFMMSQIRADYKDVQDKEWELLDSLAEANQFNKGWKFQYNWLKANQAVARMPWARTAMTGMSGVDAYTDTIQAHIMSRTMAYDDVFTKHGDTTPDLLEKAEAQHYSKMFNADGLLTNEAAKHASGEISLNIDNSIADLINNVTTALPATKAFFMFPKTSMNDIGQQLSYTPIAAIPGISRYGAILNAGNDINKIKEAMAEHGIKNFDATPNAMAMYKKLRAEYQGRVALGSIAFVSTYNYAMGGNIRGNGPVNPAERKALKDTYNWEPKTINIGGYWVSYKGIPFVDPILTLVGDMAYYQNDIGEAALENLGDKIAWTLSATWLNNTPLAGIEPVQAALNGDNAAWDRLTANLIRMGVPQSGNLGVISDAIDNAQKNIYGDMMGYVKNRLPFASSTLPKQIDYWTGEPINYIDNPWVRALNAGSPIKVSGRSEPWRRWLLKTGFDGASRMRYSSQGGYEYDGDTQERLGELIGEEKMYKQIIPMMTNKRFNDELAEMRAYRRSGMSPTEIKIKTEKLTVYKKLNDIVNKAKQRAEARLFDERPDIKEAILGQLQADRLLGRGDVAGAIRAGQITDERVEKIRQLANP